MTSRQNYTDKDTFFVFSCESIRIEVLHYPPIRIISNYPPILFIHGLTNSAWAWDNFCRWFSNQGHDCYAMSFRGYGQSTKTPKKDKWWKLNDITIDVSAVTDTIIARTGDKPILVGHSFGGGILQYYLQNNHQKVAAGVLFAATSPYNYKRGIVKYIRKLFSKMPILAVLKSLITLNPYATIETPELMKRATFSKAFPDSMAKDIHPKLDKVSPITALFQIHKPFVDPTKIKCPIIVIGAEEDSLFDLKVIKETAEAYGVEFDIIGGAAHNIMLDLTWEDSANVIFNRIQEKVIQRVI
ncbi:3215_t:CDS:2 [Funneliformis caledonium]|uniref:3215_t:CDS:1 n=1 Tax=Funneliformis caledonium TaxID=1117310 RepID=A0A9N9C5Z7_9GLOM|nr:3215_t:CDS:2 [Funneliformis caledonium]